MQSVECPKRRKYMYFLLRLIDYICDRVPLYDDVFTDYRKIRWYQLSRGALDRILKRIIIGTPCKVLSDAFYQGLLTSHRGIFRHIGCVLSHSKKSRAKCLTPFMVYYRSK